MKNQYFKFGIALMIVFAHLLISNTTIAQSPQKISYQAVVRDLSQDLTTNQEVGMQISILQGSTTGSAVYVETQNPTTNANGLISIEIGNGTVQSGNFATIDWSDGPYFIKTETDPTGGTNYSITGSSEFLSVPFALHAKSAESVSSESDPVYSSWNKSSGISITENQISDLGTYLITETDPTFEASSAKAITDLDIENWNNKSVDADLSGTERLSNKNTADGYVGLGSDLKISNEYLPAITINATYTASSESEMLVLMEQINVGDVVIRTDLNQTFIKTANPDTVKVGNEKNTTSLFVILEISSSGVASVNTATGSVIIDLAGILSQGADAGGKRISGLTNPSLDQDAATKNYVDTKVGLLTFPDDQTAAEVNYSNTASDLTATTVQAAIDELENEIDDVSSTTPDATTTVKGKLQLAGDLSGTAALPVIGSGKVSTAKIADAAITDAKIATGISSSKVGLGNVDNTTDAAKPVSNATKTALDLKANLTSPAFTGTPILPSSTIATTQTAGNNTTAIATTAFVSSAVTNTTTPDATTTVKGKLQLAGDFTGTAALPVIGTGKINSAKILDASIATVDIANAAVTDAKIATGISASKVGLGNVENTSDAAKPISTATQSALDLKANLASPVLTGTPTLPTGTIASTQSAGNNTTALATTAFVTSAVTNGATPDATTTAKGKVQLAGDLSGTAALPVIGSGKITTTKIADASVTDAKIATGISASKVGLGNVDNTSDATKNAATATLTNKTLTSPKINEDVAVTATSSELNILDGITATTAELNYTDGVTGPIQTQLDAKTSNATHTGDVTGSTALSIANNVVDGANIALGSDIQGDVMYYNGTDWARLAAGTSGQFLKTQGASANPVWDAIGSINNLADADTDTKIQVEKNADEDKIRFDLGGSEKWVMSGSHLAPKNSGLSIFVGDSAGLHDDLSDNQNIFVGYKAGYENTTGWQNTATGYQALYGNTSGYFNIANGYQALYTNTTGSQNIAMGYQALHANILGNKNIAIGDNALYLNQGDNNTAIGVKALRNNDTGHSNVAIGKDALHWNRTKSNLVAIGDSALYNNGTGANSTQAIGNTAVGSKALYGNTTGSANTAVGDTTLYTNTSGYGNIALGSAALKSNTTGFRNIAIGPRALWSNTSGYQNVAIGTGALKSTTTGEQNTAIGHEAGRFNVTGDRNVFLGWWAGFSETGSNKLYIENSNSTTPLIYGEFDNDIARINGYLEVKNGATSAGSLALFEDSDDGAHKVKIQSQAMAADYTLTLPIDDGADGEVLKTNGSGALSWVSNASAKVADADADTKIQVEESADEDKIRFDLAGTERWVMTGSRLEPKNTGFSVFVGDSAGFHDDLSDNKNTFVGYKAGYENTTGRLNIGIGIYALPNNTSGSGNIAMGSTALGQNISGSSNIAFGDQALFMNETGQNNIAIGASALYNDKSDNNIAIGKLALRYNQTGYSNVAIGMDALYRNTTASNLVAIGDSALYNNGFGASSTQAIENTAVGSKAMYTNTTGYRNTALGTSALYKNTTGYSSTALGDSTLYANTSGYENTAIGGAALESNTEGYKNIAVGKEALNSNTTGSTNTAIGYQALYSNTTGSYNVAIGNRAGYDETGSNKLYIRGNEISPLIYGEFDNDLLKINGVLELRNGSSASSLKFYEPNGYNYTKFQSQAQSGDVTYTLPAADGTDGYVLKTNGSGALSWVSNATAVDEVANAAGDTKIQVEEGADDDIIRFDVGGSETWVMTGLRLESVNYVNSVLIGKNAGLNYTGQADGNTFIGEEAGEGNGATDIAGDYNTGVGFKSLFKNTGSYNTAYGTRSLQANTSGSYNTVMGNYAISDNTTGSNNTAYGYRSLYSNKANNGSTAIGYYAMYYADSRTTGRDTYNTAIGYEALMGSGTTSNNIGQYNTATGHRALRVNTSGSNNTAIGVDAMISNTAGDMNTAIGFQALDANTTGYYNAAIGATALSGNTVGFHNTAVGYNALLLNTTGEMNTAVGFQTLQANVGGSENTAFGRRALLSNASGTKNVAVGLSAGNNSTGDGNIFLGYYAGYTETGSNKLYIENSNSASPLIYGEFDNDLVKINGSLNVTGGKTVNVTSVNAASYDLLVTDYILNVTYTLTGIVSITLPTAQCLEGRIIIVKDAGGNANTNRIGIFTQGSEKIDGIADDYMTTNYETVSLYSDGSNWFKI